MRPRKLRRPPITYLNPRSVIGKASIRLVRSKKIKPIRGGKFKVVGSNGHLHSVIFNYPHVSTNQTLQEKYLRYLNGKGKKVKPPKLKSCCKNP